MWLRNINNNKHLKRIEFTVKIQYFLLFHLFEPYGRFHFLHFASRFLSTDIENLLMRLCRMYLSRRKPHRVAKGPSIKRNRAPHWWNARVTQDPITYVRRACGTAITTIHTARRIQSVVVAAGQETVARTFRSCGTSAAAEMQSILCRAESSQLRAPIKKMNLQNRSSGTGSSLFAISFAIYTVLILENSGLFYKCFSNNFTHRCVNCLYTFT